MKKTLKIRYIKSGFTLAEVLITLGIIGIVAAITIPVLMQNIQDKQFKEAAKAAFSKASQAVQQMKQDEGGSLSTYYSTAKSFKPIFMNYFKIAQDCNWSDCVASSAGTNYYSALSKQNTSTQWMDEGQFITTDGIFFGIENPVAFNRIIITVDVNGYQKGPNMFGRDTFIFQLINDTLLPMGALGTYFENQSNGNYYCNKSVATQYQGWGCMEYVMRGIDY